MRILVTDEISEEGISLLRDANFVVDLDFEISYDGLLKKIPEYDGLIVRSRTKVDKRIIENGVKLKFIGRAGVGLDNIDVEAAKKRDIIVLNTPEAPSASVAELVFGMLLSLIRKISMCDKLMKNGEWPKKHALGFELKGKTIGIIGLGKIGKEVAKRAKAFEMKILYYDVIRHDPATERELNVQFVDLDELLRISDIITIHVPLTHETHHLINEDKLKIMKRGAILVNTSRGAIVDGKALLKHLKNGHIYGACLDVFENEPPKEPWEKELISLDNVIATPHIGSMTMEAQNRAATILANKIIDLFKGKNL
ncbi:MAG: D-2-hydroxyacid dehydrogenase [Candidatus Methanomethylicia archaeon]|nr:D-2-hydroxyacid dehydrogenase [Candidatus Methanomethylicia archaeon]MCX8169046.1 D-2-hydroxyacid dehydrogenase [Candidatus Methanomethylicia archaeon]MDW7988778.1 D-2-hydroxyacid dehydrogenase [Nitrososphaerota archaeon]